MSINNYELINIFNRINARFYNKNNKITCSTNKCGFCRKPGHNISNCKDDRFVDINLEMYFEMIKLKDDRQMMEYLHTKSQIEIAAFTTYNNFTISTKIRNIDKLILYYRNKNQEQVIRNNRHLNNIENLISSSINLRIGVSADILEQMVKFVGQRNGSYHYFKRFLQLQIRIMGNIYNNIKQTSLIPTHYIKMYIKQTITVCKETMLLLDRLIEQSNNAYEMGKRIAFLSSWNINCIMDLDPCNQENPTDQTEPECPICYEKINNNACKMNCSHEYCNNCMKTYLKKTCIDKIPYCGLCRTQISAISFNIIETRNNINQIIIELRN